MYKTIVKNIIEEYQGLTKNKEIDKEMISLLSSKNKEDYIKKNYKKLPMGYWSILLSILSGNKTDVIGDDDVIRSIHPIACNPLITISECNIYNNAITDLYLADTMTESMSVSDNRVITISNLETLMIRIVKNFSKGNADKKGFCNDTEHFSLLEEPLRDVLNNINQRSVSTDIKDKLEYNKICGYIESYNKSKKTGEPMKSYPFRSYTIHETYEQIMAIDQEDNQGIISVQPIFDPYTNKVIAMNILIGDTFVIPLAPRSIFGHSIGNKQLSLYIATERYYHNYIVELGYVETWDKLKINNMFGPNDAKKYIPGMSEVKYEWKSGNILNKWLRFYNVKYIDISGKIGIAYLAHEDTSNEASYYSRQLGLLGYHYLPGKKDRMKKIESVSCSGSIIFI